MFRRQTERRKSAVSQSDHITDDRIQIATTPTHANTVHIKPMTKNQLASTQQNYRKQ